MSDNTIDLFCARGTALDCLGSYSVDVDELGDGGVRDPRLPIVVAPPDGWIGDPDGEGAVCTNCATTEEIATYMAERAGAEQMIAREELRREPTPDEVETDEQARRIFGVEPFNPDDDGEAA